MTHPCADHFASCDHCYSCEVLGICCAAVPNAQRSSIEAQGATSPDVLHEAIVQDANTAPNLLELIRSKSDPRRAHLLMPGPISEPISHDFRKEPIYVVSSRTHR